ncbi:tubulin binding cofactor A-domain-containing protein [Phyllosticta citriasiana]|uniref:tubulin binding cofactor A-domain-containing protein n=1 Tax=Phyllosticta citriasiana TaxID=595635 RepID=UPI0030FD48FE
MRLARFCPAPDQWQHPAVPPRARPVNSQHRREENTIMAPPSKLAVLTSSVIRLVKEEASYHKELEQQQARVQELESNTADENAEYQLKQERQALEETKNVLPALSQKIQDAVAKLEDELEANKETASGAGVATDEITKAKEAVASAKTAIRESTSA